jgi:ferritin-like protein
MTEHLTLQDVDRDGAIAEHRHEAEQAVEGGGNTRAAFLVRGGALLGGGLALGSLPIALAGAQSASKADVKILNYALTLEYLEAAFYKEAIAAGKLTGETASFATVAGGDEAAHVQALRAALGSKASAEPKFDFKGTTGAMKSFLDTAKVLEDTGVSAYQGQGPNIHDKKLLAAAGSILAVEARHAAWVTDIIGGGKGPLPAPEAFSQPMSMSAVLSAVKGTGFIKS